MTPPPPPEPGLLLAGRYHLRSVLGQGGAATVWLADDDVLDRAVAVKLLHPELERDTSAVVRFRREATAAAALTHPNAVIVYDIGEDEGRVFLVMEYVDGATLSDVLDGGRLAPEDTATIGVSVGRALGAAHRRGLVHRDVKPGNVLIDRDGVVKVTDFGIATALGDAQARLTTPGMVVGTGAYLAPEQLEGKVVDARADVYSLGLVLHECLTGQPAFSGGTAAEVAARRLASEVTPVRKMVPAAPEELDLTLQRAARRDPRERFEDGAALADVLARLVPDDPTARLARIVADRLGEDVTVPSQPDHVRDPTVPTPAVVPTATGGTSSSAPAQGRDAAATTALPRSAPATSPPSARTSTLPATGDQQPPTGEASPRLSRWRRPWPWAVALVVTTLFAMAILDVVQGDGDGDEDAGGAEPAQLAVQDGSDFDPFGSGEHPEDVPNAFDGDPETSWQTQRYNSAALGGLKPGVGMWVDLGEVAPLRQIELSMRPAGADVEVYASEDALPDGVGGDWTPQDWGARIAEVSSAETAQSLELEDVEGRYVLLWFTSLPADGGGHRVHVSEIGFSG